MFGHHTRRRLHVRRALLALLLAALLLPGLLPGNSKAVTTAPRTTDMPWAVRLTFYKPSGSDAVCSGVVLTKHWIVTAAHCLHGRAKSTDQVRVDYGGSYRSTPLYAQGTASFYNHPDYDEIGFLKGDWGDDIGLVRLYGDGIFPELRAKIWDGDTDWKDGAKIFYAAGYGLGTDPGASDDCDDGQLGIKRLGRFKLTGNTDDNGIFGLGNPIAVEARSAGWYGNNRLCPGDSGGPWAFSVGAAENGEKFVFGLSGGTWKRSNPFLGGNYWAVLVRPKLFWITDVAAEKGVPIHCPRLDDLGSSYLYRQCSEGYWMVSRSASSDPVRLRSEATSLSDVAFADFNGDGLDDAFRSNRGAWYVLYAGDRDWTKVKLSTIGVGSLRFADFDGDGAVDVLQSSGGVWSVSFATRRAKTFTGWLKVKNDSTLVDALRIGDFNGDGASDALRPSGAAWYVSYSPRTRPGPGYATQAIPPWGEPYPSGLWSDWIKVKDTGVDARSLGVGDYDGDGADDVIRSARGALYVTYATRDSSIWGAARLQKTVNVALDQIATGDFNGDGVDDVFRSTGGGWYVTYGTSDRSRWGAWTRLRSSNVRQEALAFADVNGDGRTDAVFHTNVDGVPSSRLIGY